ncbi:MAG: helix-turn-helix transcriptional regulator [Deltaproteobacteria bacterium]|nr:helix-turn-helix transcriptional regulator [Deltaproteobacteria bacterium]
MNAQTLKSYLLARGLSQSDLARAAGVTRQAVSHWLSSKEKGPINLFAKHAQAVAHFLGVTVEQLSEFLPILGSPSDRKKWETELLWDRLYPDLESFIVGLMRGQRQALARLVQVCGFYEAAKIAGQQVWKRFPVYKSLIHPAYRKKLEIIWKTEKSLMQP